MRTLVSPPGHEQTPLSADLSDEDHGERVGAELYNRLDVQTVLPGDTAMIAYTILHLLADPDALFTLIVHAYVKLAHASCAPGGHARPTGRAVRLGRTWGWHHSMAGIPCHPRQGGHHSHFCTPAETEE